MAVLKTKIELYLEDNSKTWASEKNNIILQNDSDGNGDYIHTWNVSGLDKPNDSKIAEYDTAGNTREALKLVLSKRATEYPSIKDQLDDIYHNGVDGWKETIKAVKDKYPKE
jgi:hypothetical protein